VSSVADTLVLATGQVEIQATGKQPTVSIVAYTGGQMTVPGWGPVVIELSKLDTSASQISILAESADTTRDSLQQLVSVWQRYDPDNDGIVVAEMLRQLYPQQRDKAPTDDTSNAMRAALENLVGCPAGKTPSPRAVGNRLRHFRRRVVKDVYLDIKANEYDRGGAVWRLHHAAPPNWAKNCESASLRL